MQLCVSEQAVTREVSDLNDRATAICVLVRHELESCVCRDQNASFHRNPAFQVSNGFIQGARGIFLPIHAIDISARVSQDSQDFLSEYHRLDPGLSRRVDRFVEATSGKLRLHDGFRCCLRIFHVEVEQP
jgi:hypothetical protein